MKNSFSLLFSVFFFAAFSYAQDTQADFAGADPNAPVFEFVTEIHDFGDIEEGSKAAHEFEFTNTGPVPLIITNVRASCGCTTPTWTEEPIMPGNKGKIKTVFDSKGRPGKFNKAITISSNSSTPTKILFIKGNVVMDGISPEETD